MPYTVKGFRKPSHDAYNGFTLVELAIVLMIIGLLIGGILKGQELITNARITSGIRQIRSYDAATITFIDSYGAKPGDITNPSTRLPNCSAAQCNIGGNGNGVIGDLTAYSSDENNTFWLHLVAANLVSGVDTASTWTSSTYSSATLPAFPLGGIVSVLTYDLAPSASFPNGVSGPWWRIVKPVTFDEFLPVSLIARLDTKYDDGKPWVGDITLNSSGCGIAQGATSYTAITNICCFMVKVGF